MNLQEISEHVSYQTTTIVHLIRCHSCVKKHLIWLFQLDDPKNTDVWYVDDISMDCDYLYMPTCQLTFISKRGPSRYSWANAVSRLYNGRTRDGLNLCNDTLFHIWWKRPIISGVCICMIKASFDVGFLSFQVTFNASGDIIRWKESKCCSIVWA